MDYPLSLDDMTQRPQKWFKRLLRTKSRRKKAISFAIIGGNVALLAIVIAIVAAARQGSADTPLDSAVAMPVNQSVVNPLDQVSSAAIAETVSTMSGLAETIAITNQADSETTELATPPSSSMVIAQPQVVTTANNFASNKDIKTYTVQAGDTISSLATKFGITSDSIRWSNGLTGDAVAVGSKLLIPPVSGIAYKVKAGDTTATLAAKYKVDESKIIGFNNAEISGISTGEVILIPGGTVVVATPIATKWSGTAQYGYNGYDYGYCTYWVAVLRAKAGDPVPTNLGNAATWATRAAAMGLPTGSTPAVGAAVVTSTRGAGHVAYVTAVNDDGTITISEMNHAGWNKTDTRTIAADGSYRYVY